MHTLIDSVKLKKFLIVLPRNVLKSLVNNVLVINYIYYASKLMFKNICNFEYLTETLIQLKDFDGANSSANKANSIKIFKRFCIACIDVKN